MSCLPLNNVFFHHSTIISKKILHDTNQISKAFNNTLIQFDDFIQEHQHISIAILHINSQQNKSISHRGETIHRDAVESRYNGLDSIFDPFSVCFGSIRFQHYSRIIYYNTVSDRPLELKIAKSTTYEQTFLYQNGAINYSSPVERLCSVEYI